MAAFGAKDVVESAGIGLGGGGVARADCGNGGGAAKAMAGVVGAPEFGGGGIEGEGAMGAGAGIAAMGAGGAGTGGGGVARTEIGAGRDAPAAGGLVLAMGGGGTAEACGTGGREIGGGSLGGCAAAIFGTAGGSTFTPASAWVAGIAGGRLSCGIGSTSGRSTRPVRRTKTLAAGLATMTRAGIGTRFVALVNPPCPPWGASDVVGGSGAACGGAGGGNAPIGATRWEFLGGKSGVVLAVGGAPVKGGAVGRDWVDSGGADVAGEATGTGGGVGIGVLALLTLGIGLVTAVDHAGGTAVGATGSNCPVGGCIGSVVAAEILGRGVGVILAVAGFKGRGGRLMRNVSRFGALGSLPSALDSAIIRRFYS